MKTCRSCLSPAQAVAHEAASHELGRLLDDAADLLWRTHGEKSVIGHLADEARWAAFLLHDRVARHAVEDVGVQEHELAIRGLTPSDWLFRSPNRFEAEPLQPGERAALDLEQHRALADALCTCMASVATLSEGYARACARSHRLEGALEDAEKAIDALRVELERMARAASPVRARAQTSSLRAGPSRGRQGTLVLLRGGRSASVEARVGLPR